MYRFIKITTFSIILLLFTSHAFASLMVAPTRAEFEGRQRTSEIKLVNKTNEVTTYRISLQHLRMKADGSYEEIEPGQEQGEKFVDHLIRYSPRRVTLKPKEVQVIRLMIRKPKNLEAGEYRSHMLFKEEAPPNFGANIEEEEKGAGDQIKITLKPLFGISIPIIVRHGELNASANVEVIRVSNVEANKDHKKVINFKINRSGNSSVFGDIIIKFTPDGSEEEFEVGSIKGVSVYYPYTHRIISTKITSKKVDIKNGVLKVTYYGRKKDNINTDTNKIWHELTHRVD